MPQLIVEAIAPVGSWRPPEAMTFHRTYPLPPYTSVVGMMGAAMGLELADAFAFVRDQNVQLGVGGWSSGLMKDLWKIQKLGDKGSVGSAILLREHCVDVRLVLIFASENLPTLQRIQLGFNAPTFPLTAGQSDSLVLVTATRIVDQKTVESDTVHSALLYGELTPQYRTSVDLTAVPLAHTIRAPVVERIPTSFTFDEKGHRLLCGRALVTFVADAVTVPKEHQVTGYVVQTQSSFFRSRPFGCENLPWIIPVHQF
ncbi:MAG: CRISPR-associated protein Cas5 [Planctomycetaceae bacterium]